MKGNIVWKADRDGYELSPRHIIFKQAKMKQNRKNPHQWDFNGYEAVCGKVIVANGYREASPARVEPNCPACIELWQVVPPLTAEEAAS